MHQDKKLGFFFKENFQDYFITLEEIMVNKQNTVKTDQSIIPQQQIAQRLA